MMDCPEWRRCLRTSNVIERVANTPFRRMIRKMPGSVELVLFPDPHVLLHKRGLVLLCVFHRAINPGSIEET